MQIGRIGSIATTAYQVGMTTGSYMGGAVLGSATDIIPGSASGMAAGASVGGVGEASPEVKPGYKSSPAECQTCKERKYIDGSDENVSFKSAAHISPEAAMGTVRAHEGEHVANAYTKAAKGDGQVVNASVSIHTSVCPECGRTYVSGGTTNTTIRYNESNPYGRNQKSLDGARLIGGKMDFSI